MLYTTIADLKNIQKVARYKQAPEGMYKQKNDNSMRVTFYPQKDAKNDIFPYWLITVIVGECKKEHFLSGNQYNEAKAIINAF